MLSRQTVPYTLRWSFLYFVCTSIQDRLGLKFDQEILGGFARRFVRKSLAKPYEEQVDNLSPEQRRFAMSRIPSRDTGPELAVRRLLHSLGYRYRLHRRDLPGTPDIYFPSRKKAIFVHGCFWHGHRSCKRSKLPATRRDIWKKKIEKNRARDRQVLVQLDQQGISTFVTWQCELRDLSALQSRLTKFLD